ncbi:hypothetical protein JM93_02270 [Roseibium hamelinense]|uniref:Uncharacterized protein n=1 Tax=Roseibium hamelinense TaxID=150831 RepID=A0A562T1Y1_9HYPH|nr:hypothetical protein [Roseibium hamelinense]MTI42278.1 hypothetical protein [Roseibium hamelinense]TWI87701.1 hypothetical protein JM93_02270 [Roseibium hamelinense]
MECDDPVLGAGVLAAERLEQANINASTGLATDYLNHFNEVVMLLEMLPAMPDCAEDVIAWSPLGYAEHFENSSFKDKNLAILAYSAAPSDLREHLEANVEAINSAVGEAQDMLKNAPDVAEIAGEVSEKATLRIKPLISTASGIIHGHIETDTLQPEGDAAQAEIDAMFA